VDGPWVWARMPRTDDNGPSALELDDKGAGQLSRGLGGGKGADKHEVGAGSPIGAHVTASRAHGYTLLLPCHLCDGRARGGVRGLQAVVRIQPLAGRGAPCRTEFGVVGGARV
jgi:hypothetical protein